MTYNSLLSVQKHFLQKSVMSNNVAVVTGANKGIGFAVVKAFCKRYHGVVYLTSRNEKRGKDAVSKLNKVGLFPAYHQLDVTDRQSVIKFRDHIKNEHEGIDILINNAAVLRDIGGANDTLNENKIIIDTNYRSLLTIQELIYPYIRCNGRILNITSDCGHISNINNKYWFSRLKKIDLTIDDINEFVDWFLESSAKGTLSSDDISDDGTKTAYKVSKVALSALTIVQQRQLEHKNIIVNSVHPGFVRTDMTLGVGMITPDEATNTITYLLFEAPPSVRGSYVWSDCSVVEWHDFELLRY